MVYGLWTISENGTPRFPRMTSRYDIHTGGTCTHNSSAPQARVNEFEMEIINASKRNEALGKAGIVLLPGVEDLLSEVSTIRRFRHVKCSQMSAA